MHAFRRRGPLAVPPMRPSATPGAAGVWRVPVVPGKAVDARMPLANLRSAGGGWIRSQGVPTRPAFLQSVAGSGAAGGCRRLRPPVWSCPPAPGATEGLRRTLPPSPPHPMES